VDDDEDDFVLIKELLSSSDHCHYEIDWVETYEPALTAMSAGTHDVYLIDYRLGLPQSGLDLLREASAAGCEDPIIMLTGIGDSSIDEEAMQIGAADYLDKSHIGQSPSRRRNRDESGEPGTAANRASDSVLERSIRHALERNRTLKQLREANEYSNLLLSSSLSIIISVDKNRRIVEFNRAAEEAFGYTRAEILGRSADVLIANPDESDRAGKSAAEAGAYQGELWSRKKNGEKFLLYLTASPLLDDSGEIVGIMGTAHDITWQKRVEERFRNIVENASQFIFEANASGYITYVNPQAERIFGPSDQALGCYYLDFVRPDFRDKMSKASELQYRDETRDQAYEFPVVTFDKKELWVAQNVRLVIEGSKPIGFQAVGRDITDRMQAEHARLQSDMRYRDLFENSSDLIQSLAPNGAYLYANPAWHRAMGYSSEEVSGLNLLDILHPDDCERCRLILDRVIAGEVVNDIAARFVSKNGSVIHVEGSSSCQFEDGKPVATRGIFRDVTARRMAERRLAGTLREVQKSHDDMLSILNELRLGVIVIDPGGCVAFASRSCERLLGRRREDVVGLRWEEAISLDQENHARVVDRMSQTSSRADRLSIRIDAPSRQHFWAEIEVQDDPRVAGGKILMLYDVTEVHTLRQQLEEKAEFGDLVGKGEAMRLVYEQISQIAQVDTTVLVDGDTGTGKELVARALHYASHRRAKPFIAVNCAGLTESLLGSQLFGHKRGAFTGAIADHEGVFEAAAGGTVFLDEIGDIPNSLQSSLLRVLQEKEITRLGESKPRKVDVRFLAATRRDLEAEVAYGRFRDDLLYRIRVARIQLPPLRDRNEDIPVLIESFLEQCRATMGKSVDEVSAEAMRELMAHDWPGNVRELKHAIESAVIRAKSRLLNVEDLPPEIIGAHRPQLAPAYEIPQARQKDRLVLALEQTRGNHAAAARLLGIGRSTLYRHLKKHGLKSVQ
jgi:PAS domain S-box-containing protein